MVHATISQVSACIVTPSTPTTPHHMFLAAIDILWRWFEYNQRVLFFKLPANCNFGTCADHLKSSLALALVEFFPWAGRLFEQPDGRLALDCNDAGVPFIEASVDIPFSSLKTNGFQHQPFFVHLAPHGDVVQWTPDLPLLSVQVTRFPEDEGLAIGIGHTHAVADGSSLWHFLKSWGECARGLPISLHPIHMRDALHPEKLILPAPFNGLDNAAKSVAQGGIFSFGPRPDLELVQRDFHFSAGMMKKLKHMAASSCAEAPVAAAIFSSFQALTAHIWKHVTAARCIDKSRKSAVFIVANVRARCVPPLPDAYFGNAVRRKAAIAPAQELEEESIGRTAMRIVEVVRSFDDTEAKTWYGKLEVLDQRRVFEDFDFSMLKMHVFSSPRLPAYEVDFGWGSPVCVRCPLLRNDGDISLLAGPEGGGSVAVSLALSRAAMERLENEKSFMSI